MNKNVVVVAKALAPKRTGLLTASISAVPGEGPMEVDLIADKFYAPFLEYGTRPHVIQASNANALRFEIGNQVIFAKSVQHPGIPEGKFSFMGPAITEGLDQVIAESRNGDCGRIGVNRLRQPNNYTHEDESRIELQNVTLLFVGMAILPYLLFLFLENLVLVFAIEFLLLAGALDLTLTSDALHRGYAEQNYYRIFFKYFGHKDGFRITAVLNFLVRALVVLYFFSYPVLIMFVAFASFFGPLWNAMIMRSFRDDIVVEMPTKVLIEDKEQEINSGNKRRLEAYKDGSEEEPKE